jgi:hypothetical protein
MTEAVDGFDSVLLRFDANTGSLVGVTILDASRLSGQNVHALKTTVDTLQKTLIEVKLLVDEWRAIPYRNSFLLTEDITGRLQDIVHSALETTRSE